MVVGYADLMQQFSLVDSVQADYVRKQTDAAVAEINAGNYIQAFEVSNKSLLCPSQYRLQTQHIHYIHTVAQCKSSLICTMHVETLFYVDI